MVTLQGTEQDLSTGFRKLLRNIPSKADEKASRGHELDSLASVGEDDDGPIFMFILELLDQVDQVGILYFLGHQQVSLVKLLHCPHSKEENPSKI